MFVARADEGQPVLLRLVGLQRHTAHSAAQVVGQGRAHAHGKYTGFFQGTGAEGGHVTGGKHLGVAGLQVFVHLHKTIGVQRQA